MRRLPFWLLIAAASATAVAVAAGWIPIPRSAMSLSSIAAAAGWLTSVLLAAVFLISLRRWKTAFENQEWVLSPSDQVSNIAEQLASLEGSTSIHLDHIARRTASLGDIANSVAAAIDDTRAELSILRTELDSKSNEISVLRLGHEFHARRPVLRRIIHALQVIEDDLTRNSDPEQTVAGVRAELTECLQENGVTTYHPQPGTRVDGAKAIDLQRARKEVTEDEALRGTIAGAERPAYVFRGPHGAEEVIEPALVRVYV